MNCDHAIKTPIALAKLLAHYAHQIRHTLIDANLQPTELADMYAQTILYGLFAQRVCGSEMTPCESIMGEQLKNYIPATDLSSLREHYTHLLTQIDIEGIFERDTRCTLDNDPVTHFYETFLSLYHPQQRTQCGVYTTPKPVVSYIVRSVDALIQKHFGRNAGLADKQTLILDPATGTGTFLLSVLCHLYHKMQGDRGVWNNYVSSTLLPHLFGLELLMTPYATAAMRLNHQLQQLGYVGHAPLHLYCTNALLEDSHRPGSWLFDFSRELADIQRHDEQEPLLVILGNPPYAGQQHIPNLMQREMTCTDSPCFITDLLQEYYQVDGQPLHERNPKWLQDQYVKFLRFGQWYINRVGRGILAFVTNNSYLDNPTFRGMRQSLMRDFDAIYLLDLHGNFKTRERLPKGESDENIFPIRQGTVIGLFVKCSKHPPSNATVCYADLRGNRASKHMVLATQDVQTTSWQLLKPFSPWYLFVPHHSEHWDEYQTGWLITDAMPIHCVGIVTGQDAATIAFTREDAAVLAISHGLSAEKVKEILYRPFDRRFVVYDKQVVTRPRTKVMQHMEQHDNIGLVFQRGCSSGNTMNFPQIADCIIDQGLAYPSNRALSYLAPLYLYKLPGNVRQPNFGLPFIRAVEYRLGLTFIPEPSGDLVTTVGAEDIFHYIYALFHSTAYRQRYAAFLKIDFPRIQIPRDRSLFAALVTKGALLVNINPIHKHPRRQELERQPFSDDCGSYRCIERVHYVAPSGQKLGCVFLNQEHSIEGIDEQTWNMHIGGYQPLQKWLNDRKGRTLNSDEMAHYTNIITTLQHMQQGIKEIDTLLCSSVLARMS